MRGLLPPAPPSYRARGGAFVGRGALAAGTRSDTVPPSAAARALFKPPAAVGPTLPPVAGESGRAAGYAGAHAARAPLAGAPLPPHPRVLAPLCACRCSGVRRGGGARALPCASLYPRRAPCAVVCLVAVGYRIVLCVRWLPLCPLVGAHGVWGACPRIPSFVGFLSFRTAVRFITLRAAWFGPCGAVAQSAPSLRGPRPAASVVGGPPPLRLQPAP